MQGYDHYRLAEDLLDRAQAAEGMGHAPELIARAQAHAALAQAAAVIETGHAINGEIIRRPYRADPEIEEPADVGNGWGRALFGDLYPTNSSTSKDQS